MLTATAELIDEVGYDGLTTTLIAERAGVAVGSLYQFFPDKRAVVQELALRNLERFVQTISERFETERHAHWWQAVDTVFDTYLAMYREVPAFSRLHFGDVVDLRLLDPGRENNAVIAEKLTELISTEFDLDPADLLLPLTVAVEAADAVLHLAFRRDGPEGDRCMISEAKDLVRGYLSTRIPEGAEGPPAPKPAAAPAGKRSANYPNDLPSPR
ncbi:TetR family transcriptional regulator [Saccharopolyspora halophila]|uniref:TetR family transcriptional regulator n=1 Tax=Saccharopolyspora halophila TaxID=405551 RepID=A0ABP5SLW6_9PSEU